MKRTFIALTLTLAGVLAHAQAAPPADLQAFRAFGERPGLASVVDVFMAGLLADPRTGPHFKDVNQARLKEQLTDQFCAVLGGPCRYTGADMKSAHGELEITKGDFNALVEVLESAMRARDIPFPAQRQLLARLAPMHRDVITVR